MITAVEYIHSELFNWLLWFGAVHEEAVQHGDFYSAVRHSLCMANEQKAWLLESLLGLLPVSTAFRLRSCRLSPTSYYKLHLAQ